MSDSTSKQSLSLGLIEMGRFGELPARVVAAHLQALMGIAVDFLPPIELPQEAFQQNRQQYDAGLLLKHLTALPDAQRYHRLLALTTVDLCSPILTYVYGEAEIGGRSAIISSFRLHSNEDGSRIPLERTYERLAKVALHEVAHTFSLYHCEAPRCLMRFSAKLHHLDALSVTFCDRCAFMLRSGLRRSRS